MKLGLQIPSFTYPGGTETIGPTLARIVRCADDVGFDSIWVMDHFFQIRSVGPATEPMLEGWTTLGFMAANSQRARLGLMVGGVHFRLALAVPAALVVGGEHFRVLLVEDARQFPARVLHVGGPERTPCRVRVRVGHARIVVTEELDARDAEDVGCGPRFRLTSVGERFRRLEETLQIAHGMWQGERGTEGQHNGRHYRASRLLNSPQSISRPRVPIMIGGGGERKTLRLVAQYGDACNVFGQPAGIARKYAILREHCAAVGRPFEEIERSTLQFVRVSPTGGDHSQSPSQIVDRFGELADAGAQSVIFSVGNVFETERLEIIGRDVIPQLRDL